VHNPAQGEIPESSGKDFVNTTNQYHLSRIGFDPQSPTPEPRCAQQEFRPKPEFVFSFAAKGPSSAQLAAGHRHTPFSPPAGTFDESSVYH
jgi:hypothetical protein